MRVSAISRAVGLLAGLVCLLATEQASAAAFDCRGANVAVATVAPVRTRTATTFANLPGASITFLAKGCLRVQFSAQVRAKSPGVMRIRLLRNGVPEGVPASADLQTSGDGYDNRAVTFVIRNVATGEHTLQIQFLSVDGSAVRATKAVLTVWHNPVPF